jgi:hypothetical protein
MTNIGNKSLVIRLVCLDAWRGNQIRNMKLKNDTRGRIIEKNNFEDKGLRDFNLYGT